MKIEEVIEAHAHHFLLGMKAEYNGDKEAGTIIRKYIEGNKISEEEDHILKTQLMDSLKIIGVGVPFVLIPGASILIPILVKVASKHNITLMPAAFTDNNGSGSRNSQ